MKAIITQGISASGKTTWAKEFVSEQLTQGIPWVIVCRDDLRKAFHEELYQETFLWSRWNFKHEKAITQKHRDMIAKCSEQQQNIVVADTNLNQFFLAQLEELLESLEYDIEKKVFHITFDEACRRDAERFNGVGYSVIAKQHDQFLKLTSEGYTPDMTLPKAIIVDIDGTLAYNASGRSPYHWHRVEEDHVHEPIKHIVNGFHQSGHQVIIFSGRDSVCRPQTENWLKTHQVNYNELFMRKEGDSRKDTVVKFELFQLIHLKYNVVLVIDDRPVVCRQWINLGLKTLIVGNPYIEF
jgi:predicted kinase